MAKKLLALEQAKDPAVVSAYAAPRLGPRCAPCYRHPNKPIVRRLSANGSERNAELMACHKEAAFKPTIKGLKHLRSLIIDSNMQPHIIARRFSYSHFPPTANRVERMMYRASDLWREASLKSFAKRELVVHADSETSVTEYKKTSSGGKLETLDRLETLGRVNGSPKGRSLTEKERHNTLNAQLSRLDSSRISWQVFVTTRLKTLSLLREERKNDHTQPVLEKQLLAFVGSRDASVAERRWYARIFSRRRRQGSHWDHRCMEQKSYYVYAKKAYYRHFGKEARRQRGAEETAAGQYQQANPS
ncbi:hypothetical protein IW261DRAFT_1427255 [Armillaria novae-zelandiae]|uniref:Uncharacterized protein n=1 Tax=Armillaria novae-zelandiae TaxID=153914 RepID=A0AA39TN77_9AGAR|nr:hypothetical protein IW261DRAFT_1427255 [Armillaria novae-zelandiae]